MKLRDSLAENKSIRLQAEAETWQDAVKIGVDLLVAADVVERVTTRRFWMRLNSTVRTLCSHQAWQCRTVARKRVLRKPVLRW